jgi:RNA polymerase sigma-70 factor (ECF subfamily)
MEPTDKEWLDRYRQGEADALEALIKKHHRSLFGFIVNMTAGGDDPDDVFQETWLKAVRNLNRYRDDNFGGWLIRIARNTIIDRQRQRKPSISLNMESETGGSLANILADSCPSPSDQAEARDMGLAIAEAVKQLPEPQKEVFLMRVEADLSFKEISKIQKVSINTALARMQYALAKLRTVLTDTYRGNVPGVLERGAAL